ncbi:zinc-binding alcohol dehydrogenase family protein [Phanerochaete sordida]|uniref:Zinc-binding alcohol dehydrogenase family protein n=1 Tax=Phanerochaete sordida TaxID=48140 RepID=A0A9P3LCR8_9APHY|nr:zinc-binding alcohol dehydrogenase family protein [Phanerochaete sordida]
MSTQKALFLDAPKTELVIRDRDIEEPGPGEVLIEVHAVGLIHSDWRIQALGIMVTEWPTILGLDSAGVVKKVGEGVTNVAVGDRVLHQGNRNCRNAVFQHYTIALAEIVAKIPDNLSFDQAAVIPVAVGPAAIAFYNKKAPNSLGLTPPWEEGGRGKYAGEPILIMGGASAIGQQAIQLAKLGGFSPIITTCSVHNAAYVQTLGATHAVERGTALASTVQGITSKPIKYAFDTVSLPDTQNAAYEVLAPGGTLVIDLPDAVDSTRRTPDKEVGMIFGSPWLPAQREVGKALYANLTALLEAGEIKPNNFEVLPNGLAGIPEGLEKVKKGVSALKFVAHPQETK